MGGVQEEDSALPAWASAKRGPRHLRQRLIGITRILLGGFQLRGRVLLRTLTRLLRVDGGQGSIIQLLALVQLGCRIAELRDSGLDFGVGQRVSDGQLRGV